MQVPITNLFHAYDLQADPYDLSKVHCQEVVSYFETRFRVALQAIMKRSEEDQEWMYKLLFRELVFFLLQFMNIKWNCF